MATRRKKKTASSAVSAGSAKNKRSRRSLDLAANDDDDDEHIYSSDEDDNIRDTTPSFDEESEEENLEVKKVRLAREYLQRIDAAVASSDDDDSDAASSNDDKGDDDDENMLISRKLQRERLKRQGALERDYADAVEASVTATQKILVDARPALRSLEQQAADWVEQGYVTLLTKGGHDLTPTCVSLTGDSLFAVSGSKDHSVLLWDVERQAKVATLCERWKKNSDNRNAGQVLSVACSDDGKYVVVGKRDAIVSIYDIRGKGKNSLVTTFAGHKGAVTGLAFRSHSHQLFSASEDRCIRHYNLDEMLYLETLYGHQFGVTGIDCHNRERPISVSRDRTARAWKLAEDSHLIFRGGSKVQSADAVTVLKDEWFVSGHQDGVVALWNTEKKRAMSSVEHAHGTDPKSGLGRGVVSISCIKGSDVAATGSSDGYLRLWKVRCTTKPGGRSSDNKKDRAGIDAIGQIPVHGFINDICFSNKAKFCVAAVGQEHRLGRWERVPRAKNRIAIIKLKQEMMADDDDNAEHEQPTSADLDFEALD